MCVCADVCAHPASVNVLSGALRDARTPDKLADGHNARADAAHAWLAPVLPRTLNRCATPRAARRALTPHTHNRCDQTAHAQPVPSHHMHTRAPTLRTLNRCTHTAHAQPTSSHHTPRRVRPCRARSTDALTPHTAPAIAGVHGRWR